MTAKVRPTQEYLRECFDYLPSGELCWRARPMHHFSNLHRKNNWNSQWAGKIAGCADVSNGYVKVCIGAKRYYAHHLVWLWHNGHWPKQIDHKDMNRSHNRIENLREADYFQNAANRRMEAGNRSGYKGIWWSKNAKKWQAQIIVRKRKIYLGYFLTKELAAEAYRRAAVEAWGEFARVA